MRLPRESTAGHKRGFSFARFWRKNPGFRRGAVLLLGLIVSTLLIWQMLNSLVRNE